jgi:hypothetical protein
MVAGLTLALFVSVTTLVPSSLIQSRGLSTRYSRGRPVGNKSPQEFAVKVRIQPTHSERAPQCSLPESIDSCLSEAQLPAQLRLDDRLVHLPSACCESPVQLG